MPHNATLRKFPKCLTTYLSHQYYDAIRGVKGKKKYNVVCVTLGWELSTNLDLLFVKR